MNVLVIVNSLTGGGAERVATNLASSLSKYVDKVVLAVLNGNANTYGATVETVNLDMKKKNKVLWYFEAIHKMKKIKTNYNITHSISFLGKSDLINVLSRKSEKILISVRNNWFSRIYGKNKLWHIKNKWVVNKADYVVALSKKVSEDIIQNYKVNRKNITTIYNPCYVEVINEKIDNAILSEEEKQFFACNSGKVVITAGRLEDQKGQWHLIRAFSEVLKSVPDAKLLILGQGQNLSYLERLIKDYDLKDNIFLLGYKVNPYIYLKCSDFFVFTSIYEGLGNILLECMACCLPVISVDCPFGPKELIGPECDINNPVSTVTFAEYGILTPPMNGIKYEAKDPLSECEKQLVNAILSMLLNSDLKERYRKKILERSRDFLPDVITLQWVDILKSL